MIDDIFFFSQSHRDRFLIMI